MVLIEVLERREFFNAAFDLIGLTRLRNDPQYSFLNGSGVSVAILDTGLDSSHPLLSPNYKGGVDIVNGGNTPTPVDPHGTHVAGIIGATDPEIGVANDVGLLGVQVFSASNSGDLGATNNSILQGLQWVEQHRLQFNIVAVNLSLGEGFYTSASQVAGVAYVGEINKLQSLGVSVISAAGNSFFEKQTQNSSDPAIISTLDVGAVWKDGSTPSAQWQDGAIDFTTGPDRLTSFSQRPNTSNAIFAPGAIITSTFPGGKFGQEAGTSQATPMVTGAVALLQQAAERYGGRLLRPSEVTSIIRSTADQIFDGDDENDNVRNTQTTYPRLDIYNAVRAVQAMFSGSAPAPGNNAPDSNGTIAGAIAGPALNGAPADAISGNIGSDGAGTTVGASDVDMYSVSVASAGVLGALTSGAGTEVRIFDASGAQLAAGVSVAGIQVQPGNYFIGVSGAGNASYDPNAAGSGSAGVTGDYSLQLSLSNADPNGTLAGAVEVNFGTNNAPLNFQGNIGTDYGQPVGVADVDLFKVVVPDNGTLRINIDTPYASGYVDSVIRVFDQQGNLVNVNDDGLATGPYFDDSEIVGFGGLVYKANSLTFAGHSTDSFLSGTANRGDVYYIGVSDFTSSYDPRTLAGRAAAVTAGGLYNLSITFDSFDTNGAIEQVSQQSGNPTFQLVGNIGADNGVDVGDRDVDFIKIAPTSAGVLQVDVDSAGLSDNLDPFDAVLYLFDSNGSLLAVNDDRSSTNPDPRLAYRITPGATYYVAVAGFGNSGFDPHATGSGTSGQTGTYVITSQMLAPSAARTLADDTIGSPAVQEITRGASVFGVLGSDNGFSRGAGDVDLYKFTPTVRQMIRVATSTSEKFDADTFLRVFDANGKEIAFNDDASARTTDSSVTFLGQPGVAYYIGVSGSGNARAYNPVTGSGEAPGSTGNYQLTVNPAGPRIPDGPDFTVAVAASPATIRPDGRFSVTAMVQNIGALPARSNVVVNLFASSDNILDSSDVLLGSTTQKINLAVNRKQSFPIKFASPTKVPSGKYFLIAQINPKNRVIEQNFTNNVGMSRGTVNIVQPFVDLRARLGDVPDSLASGTKGSVLLILKNAGNAAAKGTVRVRLVASADQNPDQGDVQLLNFAQPISLNANALTTLKLRFPVMSGLSGDDFLVAVVSYSGIPGEKNSADHVAFSQEPVRFS